MANGEQLLIETHGMVREMSVKIETMERDMQDAKNVRTRIHERQDNMGKTFVTKKECSLVNKRIEDTIHTAVVEAMNGKRRNRWLIIKDIILVVLSTSMPLLMGYFLWAISQGRFAP